MHRGFAAVHSGTIEKCELFYMPDGIKPWPDQTVDWTMRVFAEMWGGKVDVSS